MGQLDVEKALLEIEQAREELEDVIEGVDDWKIGGPKARKLWKREMTQTIGVLDKMHEKVMAEKPADPEEEHDPGEGETGGVVVDPQPEPEPVPPPPPTPPIDLSKPRKDRELKQHFDYGPLPFEAPPVPKYFRPTRADCDWIIAADGSAMSTRGLPARPAAGNPVQGCYKDSMTSGHPLPITIGIEGDAGKAFPGRKGNLGVNFKGADNKWAEIELEIVGLTPDAKIRTGWKNEQGFVRYFALFDIGIQAMNDAYIVKGMQGCDRIIFDGTWWMENRTEDGLLKKVKSGITIDDYNTFIWVNQKVSDSNRDIPFASEHDAYGKSNTGDRTNPEHGTWIIANEFHPGTNRTAFQIRPEKGFQPAGCMCPIVCAQNVSHQKGWPHDVMEGDGDSDGGGVMTFWASPEDPIYVFDNKVTDARYGCLVFCSQGAHKNFPNAGGWSLKAGHVFRNTLENKRGNRDTATFSGVEELHFYPGNVFEGPGISFDTAWSRNKGSGKGNGKVVFHGREVLDTIAAANPRTTYGFGRVPAEGEKNRDMAKLTRADLEGSMVPS